MSYDPQDHPLHGVGLEAVLSSVVRHYGWPILAEQIPINCFKSYPTFASAVKFLKKTEWARERLEAFYLYRYKQCELPSDEEHELAPRNRHVSLPSPPREPAAIEEGDAEFFDDPVSGPKFPSRKEVQQSKASSRAAKAESQPARLEGENETEVSSASQIKEKPHSQGVGESADPWAKWRN